MTTHTRTYTVNGMHCTSCQYVISDTLRSLPGVDDVKINVVTNEAHVTYDPAQQSTSSLNTTLSSYGYTLIDTARPENTQHTQASIREIWYLFPMIAISFFMLGWEMIAGKQIGLFVVPKVGAVAADFFHHIMPIFATIILFGIGRKYIVAVWRFMRTRTGNMDTLVGLSALTAYIYTFIVTAFESLVAPYVIKGLGLYDMVIITVGLVSVGQYLEIRAKQHTSQALQELAKLAAKSAIVLRDDKQVKIDIDQVSIGDVMVVKPGEIVPTDGVIMSGSSAFDESLLTGESIPKEKGINDPVYGGTVNGQGSVQVRATKIGSDTLFARIMTMVQQAIISRAPIQKLADIVSMHFVYIVLVVSILTLVGWIVFATSSMGLAQAIGYGIASAVAVLAIACPCSLGLATPTALMVAVGRGAQRGILIKNAESLERLAHVTAIAFDKTGTLTQGAPRVQTPFEKSHTHAMSIMHALLVHSAHPLAQGVVTYAQKHKVPTHVVEGFVSHPGQGVSGIVAGREYYVGSRVFVQAHSDGRVSEKENGSSLVYLADGKSIIHQLELHDPLKEHAKDAIQSLHKLGITPILLTGDTDASAKRVAQDLKIDEVYAHLLPEDKVRILEQIRAKYGHVAMIGDGVNDAPALAKAYVSIAMSTGSDVSIETADITLLQGDISKVVSALKLSRSTLTTIKQNLIWSFGYNVIGIPLASGALYPLVGWLLSPAIAGTLMAFQSVSVVLNSLRLRYIKF